MLSVLIPCYNESEVLELTYHTVMRAAEAWGDTLELLLVDDGSQDDTWAIIERLAERDSRVKGLRLSRNFGHQAALGAGLEQAQGDAIIVLDADLQDPPTLVQEMLAKWRDGYDVVYAQRNCRQGESAFKKVAGNLFYRILDCVNEVSIPRDTGDFCLMDARVARLLVESKEHALFWRGLRCWAGFRQTAVHFDRPARALGESKYTLAKLVQLATNGLLSFSTLPLRLSLYLGGGLLGATLMTTLGAGVWFLVNPADGWPVSATALLVLFIGSIQLLCLGVMGEYMNRIYDEVRARPRWVVQSTVGESHAESIVPSDFQRKAA